MNNETLKRDLCARLMERVNVCVRTNLLSYTHKPYKEYKKVLTPAILAKIIKGGQYNYIKPMLFPTSALTKPIRLANYNNGEPFVPIYELARLFHTISPDSIEDYTDAVEYGFYGAQCTCWLSVKEGRCNYFQMPFGDFITSAEFRIIEKLNQWHINYRLSPDQFVEVTEENNPYI